MRERKYILAQYDISGIQDYILPQTASGKMLALLIM